MYASGRNKWEAIANVMLMSRLYAEGYTAKYTSLKCKQQEWLKFFIVLEDQRLTESFLDIFSVSRSA